MPTIMVIGPYRFFFFSREGQEPEHIHVSAAGKEAKIWLAKLELAYSYGFKSSELKTIMALAREHQHIFKEAWNEHFGN